MTFSCKNLFLAAVSGVLAVPAAFAVDTAKPVYSAEIRRTAFGVPHIKASNPEGLGYGVGYAYAQDNICVTADAMVTAKGERSKYFGPDASYDPMGVGQALNNLRSDFFYKYLNQADFVRKEWKNQPSEIKHLLQGYAAGYNRYLKEAGPGGLPAVCAHQPWVREISPLDVMRLFRHLTKVDQTGEADSLIDAMYNAQPPAKGTATLRNSPPAKLNDFPVALLGHHRGGIGSNGAAFGKEATESGAGLLLSNPHFPWLSAYRFYQLHLTIPGRLDVMGSSLGGLPFVAIGFNAYMGWTHTTSTAIHSTLFKLQLDPAYPTRYVVDGKTRNLRRKELHVDIKIKGGGTRTIKRDYYFSEHGPLLVFPDQGMKWSRSSVLALRNANWENDRIAKQYWAFNQATSLHRFRTSLENIMGVPWNNVVAVDKPGTVYFGDITTVPHVSAAKLASCVPEEFKPLAELGLVVLDGQRSACNWGHSPGAPQKGIFAAKDLPRLQRTDYVQNSNESAWLSNPAAPLAGYSPLVSRDGYQQNGRTRISLRQIAARFAGTDGLPGNKFDLESLAQVAFSNQSFYAETLLPGLKTACEGAGKETTVDGTVVDIAKGCEVLATWDGTANLDAVGWPLFERWQQVLINSGVDYWATPFDAKDPVNTPRGLRVADPAVVSAARLAMAEAMHALDAEGIDYTLPWGQIQVAVRGNERIPIHGGAGFDDIYNSINSIPLGDGQLDALYGSSAIWLVSFEGDTPKVQGVLTYSQSTDPQSPHYADQTRRFSSKRWITFPFTESQITHAPDYSTRTISE